MNRERSSGALDLLALGRACVDEILEVEAYPAEDQKRPLTARIREGGGQASTAACLAGHLGGRVAFLGVLGADEGGTFVRARMKAFGVEVASTPQPRGVTPVAFCIVARRSGTRTILYEPSKEGPLEWAELDLTLVERARTVLVDPQAEHVIPPLLPLCRSLGIPLIADAEHARGDDWRQTWGQSDVLAASETFLREIGPGLTAEEAIEVASREARGTVLATLVRFQHHFGFNRQERAYFRLASSDFISVLVPRHEHATLAEDNILWHMHGVFNRRTPCSFARRSPARAPTCRSWRTAGRKVALASEWWRRWVAWTNFATPANSTRF